MSEVQGSRWGVSDARLPDSDGTAPRRNRSVETAQLSRKNLSDPPGFISWATPGQGRQAVLR